jgi:CheY-like chemotaxis protein
LARLLLSARQERPEEEIRQIHYILRSAEDLTAIVNDLLDLAKVEAGKIELHPVDFELSTLFGALRGMFRPLQSTDVVSLIFEEPSGIPPLFTDEGKVAQIVRNFVSNAMKFTEKGEVRVSARYSPEDDMVSISVKDTGIGIPAEHLDRIFEEFSQVDSPVQRRVKGTGLGLPLVRRLTAMLGGAVTVESKLGEGSTFTARISRRLASSDGPPPRIATVLAVDDDEIARYLLRQRFSQADRLLEAGGGSEGLRLARLEKPDVVFLDLNMPEVNGWDVLREMRRDAALQATAVVIITAQPLSNQETADLERLGAVVVHKSSLAESDSLTVEVGPPVRVHLGSTRSR